ncbi:Hsp20/alpha crystallin family protein [Clostridium sp. CTA-5]
MFGLIPFKKYGVKSTGDSFEDFITGFFNDDFFSKTTAIGNFTADIKETSNEYILQADLPGVNKEDINIEYRNNYLTISAKRNEVINEDNNNYIRRERHYGEVSRSFYVDNIDRNLIRAKFENGELYVTLPKINKIIDSGSRIEIE